MGRNSNYIDGIAALFQKYKLDRMAGAVRQAEDAAHDYDAWFRDNGAA